MGNFKYFPNRFYLHEGKHVRRIWGSVAAYPVVSDHEKEKKKKHPALRDVHNTTKSTA